ncbi:unnamed protein product [marine sediment metagenome]|uniref:Uncharacterized protein n=1 Tax=marine sediment metagenome TaxID=412755 RepID=X1SVP3_9ZZZZ
MKTKDKEVQTKETYEQRFKAAKETGHARQVSYSITSWEEEGKVLIGRLLKVKKVSSKDIGGTFEGEVNKYLFDTDEGLVSCICGSAVDRVIDGQEARFLNQIMALEYQGKRQLSQGREFNDFRIDIISTTDQKDDIPF